MQWQEDKRWSDRYIPHVQQLLGLACIHIATLDQDRKENTDLMFEVGWHRFPVRIRRLEQRLAYNRRNEVTFRCCRRSGVETELAKLLNGWGDCFLYGWGDDRSDRVRAYSLLDLHLLRGWICEQVLSTGKLPGRIQEDRDGSAAFVAFCLDCMPPEVLRKRMTMLPDDPPNTDLHWLQYHGIAA